MSRISNYPKGCSVLWDQMKDKIEASTSLENAAQRFTEGIYQEFKDSIVLIRLFAVIPFRELPEFNQRFVTQLANSAGISQLIKEKTLVLSLLGTQGIKTEWNKRLNSKGHIGIPLASADFIDRMPMMSRLLKELGVDLNWINSDDTEIVVKKIGSMSGVFYVPDAATTTDHIGRKIIAAQDFVKTYNIKTVFGLGGSYMGRFFIVTIVFTNESLDKNTVTQYVPIIHSFKASTMLLVIKGKIFL